MCPNSHQRCPVGALGKFGRVECTKDVAGDPLVPLRRGGVQIGNAFYQLPTLAIGARLDVREELLDCHLIGFDKLRLHGRASILPLR